MSIRRLFSCDPFYFLSLILHRYRLYLSLSKYNQHSSSFTCMNKCWATGKKWKQIFEKKTDVKCRALRTACEWKNTALNMKLRKNYYKTTGWHKRTQVEQRKLGGCLFNVLMMTMLKDISDFFLRKIWEEKFMTRKATRPTQRPQRTVFINGWTIFLSNFFIGHLGNGGWILQELYVFKAHDKIFVTNIQNSKFRKKNNQILM